MKTQVSIEPWFSGLLVVAEAWLKRETEAGRMSEKDRQGSFAFTYDTGARHGIKVRVLSESEQAPAANPEHLE